MVALHDVARLQTLDSGNIQPGQRQLLQGRGKIYDCCQKEDLCTNSNV